ncbi:type II secretion system F family protein [Hymenobacter sp. BT186]|uniref:General secretion pathway protein F n=1 Tax=Hymenobacter telluris TaxID=2816474 RepID=A0A939JBN9_9BACT|nr:type II secretion system F family protein [Hymenobacter telluris]MBO0361134.1 type II secretion system F family protein [Hymenobacter telluris]MBW3377162.1 type II secretion system F family protein [Hymenobacter norwichensis]
MSGLQLTPSRRTAPKPPAESFASRLGKLLNQDLAFGSRRLKDSHKEALYLELGLLLSAGVDIKAALDLQVQQQGASMQRVLAAVRDSIVGGRSLSAALQQSGHFTPYEYHSLQIGEETGQLVAIVEELARFYTRKIKQRRQVTQAMAYPIVVLSTAVAAVLFMLNFIVPMFSDVFKQFGGKLPPLTQAIVYLSALVRSYWSSGAVILLLILLALRLARRTPAYQRLASELVLRLPIIGPIVKRVYLARLCSSLALLSGAHVPLLQALTLARQMLGFWPINRALEEVEARIMRGATLYGSLQQFPIFDARMIALLKVGEEVNKLDHFFSILAQQYSEEVEYRTSLLSTALEPLIIIFLGLVVGTILVGMYLPIFQMSSAIG